MAGANFVAASSDKQPPLDRVLARQRCRDARTAGA
jgi:hypothetical protein